MKLIKLLIGIVMLMCLGMGIARAASSYTIQKGDTLSGIALGNKTTVEKLLSLNPTITNPDKIFAGNKIVLAQETKTARVVSMKRATQLLVPQPSTTVTTSQNACDPVKGIAQLKFSKEISEKLISAVQDNRLVLNTEEEISDRSYAAEDEQTQYTFVVTKHCTFGKLESPRTSFATGEQEVASEIAYNPPPTRTEPHQQSGNRLPDAQPKINNMSNGKTVTQQPTSTPEPIIVEQNMTAEQFVERELKEISQELIKVLGPSEQIPAIALQILKDRYIKPVTKF